MTDKSDRLRQHDEPREDASVEREYCPACQTIFLPGRGCWCAKEIDDNRRHLRPAA